MGDRENSGGWKTGGETVVVDHGKSRSSCGYCKSNSSTSISHGLWAHSITVDDYQELLDRGWRRSGCYLYKPQMERTCCPSFTIRLKAGDFVPSKEQLRAWQKMERWVPYEIARPLLDKRRYVVLSDYKNLRFQESSHQPLNSSSGSSGSPDMDEYNPRKSFCGEDEETGYDLEGSYSGEDNELDSEADCVLPMDDLMGADISSIMIYLHGSHVRYKDLQLMFGPIDKSYHKELEMQLSRYVVAVGQELSKRMAYSLS